MLILLDQDDLIQRGSVLFVPTVLECVDLNLEVADMAKRWAIDRQVVPVGPNGSNHGGNHGGNQLYVPPRTPGVHLSGVLTKVAVAIKVLAPGEPIEEDLPILCALGFMWEEFAASLYETIQYQPGEVCQDGIYMTCDGLNAIQLGGEDTAILEEFKFTTKKAVTAEDFLKAAKIWYWRHQGMGYCKGYGVNFVRWHVMFVRGDYGERGSTGMVWPIYRRYLVHFTDEEIEQNWRMVLRNKESTEPERWKETVK